MTAPLPADVTFEPMSGRDVKRALSLIERFNPDDAQCARASYGQGLDGQFVLRWRGEIVGVTGARPIPMTDRSWWLSWTYLDPPGGVRISGQTLVDTITDHLRRQNARKVFAMVSGDDAPADNPRRVGGAKRLLEACGFTIECEHADYYGHGERMVALSMRLTDPVSPGGVDEDARFALITDADEIFETDDAYFIDWQFAEEGIGSSRDDMEGWIEQIRAWDGRVAFVGLPGHAILASAQFTEVGFRYDGRLTDLIEDGVDEVRYRFDL